MEYFVFNIIVIKFIIITAIVKQLAAVYFIYGYYFKERLGKISMRHRKRYKKNPMGKVTTDAVYDVTFFFFYYSCFVLYISL
jgi:hypothetical protein